jgi:hypothetical protein
VRPPFCSSVALSLCLAVAGSRVHAAAPFYVAAPVTGEAHKVAVLPLRIDGQVDAATRERWTAGLRGGLARGDAELVDPAQVAPYLDGNCERQSCYDKVRANSGATHLVRTTIVAKNRDFILKLDLIDAKTGAVVADDEDICEICGSEEMVTLLDSQGALLQTRLAAMGTGPAVLILDSKPSGAVVYIDGEVVGKTPLERPVLEGSHKIRFSLDGYVAEERELKLVNGTQEKLAVDLKRTPGSTKSRALGAAGLSGGLLLLATGVSLLVLDDLEYKPNCSGANKDAQDDCRYLYNTGPLGGVLIGVGAIVGTLGAVALHRNRGAKADKRRAHLTPRGLGIAGRF